MSEETKLPKVELLPAFRWICDECCEDNYGVGIRIEPSHPQYEELREQAEEIMGEDEWCDGEWCMNPDTVTCGYCGTKFAVEERGNEL